MIKNQNSMKNNFPSDDDIVLYLNAVIDRELEKPFDKQDIDLIEECSEFLNEIDGEKYLPDKEIKEQKLAELLRICENSETKRHAGANNKKKLLKRIFIASAVFVLLLVLSVFTAAVYNGMTLSDIINKIGLFNIPTDHSTDESGLSIIRGESYEVYSSVEELEEAKKIDIIYPEWLPEGVKIENISYYTINEIPRVIIVFDNDEIFYSVDFENIYGDPTNFKGSEVYTYNGIDYIILPPSNKSYQVYFYNQYYYSFTAPDYETAINIIHNLK